MMQALHTPRGKAVLFVLVFLIFTNLGILLDIPVMRQVLGFLFYTIIPGLLIVYSLRLGGLGPTEKILLSLGISISFLMLFGFVTNALLLAVGYPTPLAAAPLIISFSIAIIILLVIACRRNKDFTFPFQGFRLTRREKIFLIIPSLFPILSIIGMRLMEASDNNVLLVTLLSLIVLVVLYVSIFQRRVPDKIYPGVIFLISISLLLMFSLRSNHVIGSDTHLEYYTFQVASDRLFWTTGVAGGALDVCLGVSVLPTVYQSFLDIAPEFLFKVLFSLFVSALPLVVYVLSKKYVGSFYAFLASVFFMTQAVFLWTPAEVRSNLATLFLALALMVLFHASITKSNKKLLYILFATSCITSHYSTSYVFFFILLLAWLVRYVLPALVRLWDNWLPGLWSGLNRMNKSEHGVIITRQTVLKPARRVTHLTGTGIALFFGILFLFYSQATDVAFKDGVRFLHNTIISLQDFFLAEMRGPAIHQVFLGHVPDYQEAVLLRTEVAFTWGTILFMAIGLLFTVMKFTQMVTTPFPRQERPDLLTNRFDTDFFAISLASYVLLVFAVVLPYVTSSYGIGRTHFVAMIPLSLFFVLGGAAVARALRLPPRLVICFILIPYLMLTTGLMYQVFGFPRALTLNSAGYMYDSMYIHDEESYAIKWMAQNGQERVKIYSERIRLIESQGGVLREDILPLVSSYHEKDKPMEDYIFLRYLNVVEGVYVNTKQTRSDLFEECPDLLDGKNRLYTNGGSEVYRLPVADFW